MINGAFIPLRGGLKTGNVRISIMQDILYAGNEIEVVLTIPNVRRIHVLYGIIIGWQIHESSVGRYTKTLILSVLLL